MGQVPHKLILLFILAFLSHTTLFCQTKNEIISNIRKEFQAINSDNTYKVVKLEGEEFTEDAYDGGSELKGYFKGNQLKKIYTFFGVSSGLAEFEYYYLNDELIFVYETFKSFQYNEVKGEMDYTKTRKTFEGRFYFDKKKLIHKIVSGQSNHEDDKAYPEQYYISQSNDLVRTLSKKNK